MNVFRRNALQFAGAAALVDALTGWVGFAVKPAFAAAAETFEVSYSDEEWRKRLNPKQYTVLRHEGTERPFTSPLNDEHRAGIFACAGCSLDLFSSKTKFDSGTGWPSFFRPLDNAVRERRDGALGMLRTEVHCRRCGGHLGHVFDDGPKPTGLRYCMNGVSLAFRPQAAG
ncbi:MAG TPA: peptide-methionine (R)-S-oxide reductase MsrB [Rhizobacter sp.]|nr:peptide-methionine (R)-S-oxide reductase MsrB [Rhizobacter sp.]